MNRGSDPTSPEEWAGIGQRIAATTHDAAETAAALARSLADREALVKALDEQLSRAERARQHQLEMLQASLESIARLRGHVTSDRDALETVDARCGQAADQLRQRLRQYGDSTVSPQAAHVAHLIDVLGQARGVVDAGVTHLEQLDTALHGLTAHIRETHRAARPSEPVPGRAPSVHATRDVLTRLAIVTEGADLSARGLAATGRIPSQIPPSGVHASTPAR